MEKVFFLQEHFRGCLRVQLARDEILVGIWNGFFKWYSWTDLNRFGFQQHKRDFWNFRFSKSNLCRSTSRLEVAEQTFIYFQCPLCQNI